MLNLQELPKLKDSISYLYIEHAIIERDNNALLIIQKDGKIPVPISTVTCLLLGPGTRVTHAAIRVISEFGCLVVWCGEGMGRFYAVGMGETRSAKNLLLQAKLCIDKESHIEVVRRMYEIRFPGMNTKDMTINQIRGMEGIRVRKAYELASKRTGVKWNKRFYKRDDWENADPVNQALSIGNALLYGVCHGAIVSLGYSPALGFVHTGKQLSFVYDIADLYKAETTIPAAFEAVRKIGGGNGLEREVRMTCRKYFSHIRLLNRIADDIVKILKVGITESPFDSSDAVGELWDEEGELSGGVNYGGFEEEP